MKRLIIIFAAWIYAGSVVASDLEESLNEVYRLEAYVSLVAEDSDATTREQSDSLEFVAAEVPASQSQFAIDIVEGFRRVCANGVSLTDDPLAVASDIDSIYRMAIARRLEAVKQRLRNASVDLEAAAEASKDIQVNGQGRISQLASATNDPTYLQRTVDACIRVLSGK